jgi:hypothetical protein
MNSQSQVIGGVLKLKGILKPTMTKSIRKDKKRKDKKKHKKEKKEKIRDKSDSEHNEEAEENKQVLRDIKVEEVMTESERRYLEI